MEPRIQYAKTSDGVSIAYWTLGEGEPFVHTPNQFSHIQLEWQDPDVRRWYQRLAEKRMLVRYDGRGTGLSERDVADYSMDARLLDLEAVVERLRLGKFILWGGHDWGPVAIAYAARWSQHLSHLVLWCTWPKTFDPPWAKSLDELITEDWRMATETIARGVVGWSAGQEALRLAAFMRESVTPEGNLALSHEADKFDVIDILPQVRLPTLVLHRRQLRFTEIARARELASRIPDARLVVVEGRTAMPWLEDMEAVAQAIDEFLSEGDEQPTRPEQALPEGMTAILFLDIAGSTELTSKLGDAAYREKERALDTALRQAIRDASGTPVEGKLLGDGVLAAFTSARQAIDAALRCRGLGNDAGLPLHLGIHAGDVIREGKDVHGGAVQLAARIHDLAALGEILVSDVVRALARTSAGVTFEDRGERELKGIAEPQRLFAVRERD